MSPGRVTSYVCPTVTVMVSVITLQLPLCTVTTYRVSSVGISVMLFAVVGSVVNVPPTGAVCQLITSPTNPCGVSVTSLPKHTLVVLGDSFVSCVGLSGITVVLMVSILHSPFCAAKMYCTVSISALCLMRLVSFATNCGTPFTTLYQDDCV